MRKYSMLIGRFQPFHDGHFHLVRTVLQEFKNVLIAVRNTEKDEDNPYTYRERRQMILKRFKAAHRKGRIRIMLIPDITEVCYGRNVGWGVREIRLSPEMENIRGSDIRNENNLDNG